MTAYLTLDGLEKSFGENRVVRHFDLGVAEGEFISLLGPSGCGKTTVLRMIAGFEQPSAGRILIDGQDVSQMPPAKRKIGMVFQAYALFPNMTAADNVGFGLRIAGVPKAERAGRVAEMLALIGLPDKGGLYPYQLSGGQQQRVALARALAPHPRVLLLDEPLSALDAKVRVRLRTEIREIQKRLGITTIFVTHDQEEALSVSDRVVVMHEGVADQVGAPADIYTRPATPFVASFVGTLNQLPAEVIDAGAGRIRIAGAEFGLGRALPSAAALTLGARPEALRPDPAGFAATVEMVEFMGAVRRVRVRLPDGTPLTWDGFNTAADAPPEAGATVRLGIDPRDLIPLAG